MRKIIFTSFAMTFVLLSGVAAASALDAPFVPLPVTVVASATTSDDAGSGCTVQVSTANTFVDAGFIIFLTGAEFALSERTEPGSARELCRVVQTAAKDPSDQSALARVLNKVLRGA